MTRTWNTVGIYDSYEEASNHREQLIEQGFTAGDTVKVKRCGARGMKYAVKTTPVTTKQAKGM